MNRENLVPIIGDGAIGLPDLADGRLIPVLIIDCSTNKNLLNAIYLQQESRPGDVRVTWGRRRFSTKKIYLSLELQQPVHVEALFEFDIQSQGGLVDAIIRARGAYLQPKESGLRVSQGLNGAKLLVEIPPETELPEWDRMYKKELARSFRNQGASRQEANAEAKEHVARVRELWVRKPRV